MSQRVTDSLLKSGQVFSNSLAFSINTISKHPTHSTDVTKQIEQMLLRFNAVLVNLNLADVGAANRRFFTSLSSALDYVKDKSPAPLIWISHNTFPDEGSITFPNPLEDIHILGLSSATKNGSKPSLNAQWKFTGHTKKYVINNVNLTSSLFKTIIIEGNSNVDLLNVTVNNTNGSPYSIFYDLNAVAGSISSKLYRCRTLESVSVFGSAATSFNVECIDSTFEKNFTWQNTKVGGTNEIMFRGCTFNNMTQFIIIGGSTGNVAVVNSTFSESSILYQNQSSSMAVLKLINVRIFNNTPIEVALSAPINTDVNLDKRFIVINSVIIYDSTNFYLSGDSTLGGGRTISASNLVATNGNTSTLTRSGIDAPSTLPVGAVVNG